MLDNINSRFAHGNWKKKCFNWETSSSIFFAQNRHLGLNTDKNTTYFQVQLLAASDTAVTVYVWMLAWRLRDAAVCVGNGFDIYGIDWFWHFSTGKVERISL